MLLIRICGNFILKNPFGFINNFTTQINEEVSICLNLRHLRDDSVNRFSTIFSRLPDSWFVRRPTVHI